MLEQSSTLAILLCFVCVSASFQNNTFESNGTDTVFKDGKTFVNNGKHNDSKVEAAEEQPSVSEVPVQKEETSKPGEFLQSVGTGVRGEHAKRT